MFHPTKGNLDSGMRKIFAIEIQNPTIFSVESGIIGFGIRNTAQEILNPTHDKNPEESSTSSAKSKLWNHELKTVFDSLAWGEIFILYLFIHQVSSPLCCEHHLLEVNNFYFLLCSPTNKHPYQLTPQQTPNWFLYRLTMDRMKSLRDVSTHWRATHSYDKYSINNYKDYVRGKFSEADIFAFLGSGFCLKTEFVNIHGHTGIHKKYKTARFWQVDGIYTLHIDSLFT